MKKTRMITFAAMPDPLLRSGFSRRKKHSGQKRNGNERRKGLYYQRALRTDQSESAGKRNKGKIFLECRKRRNPGRICDLPDGSSVFRAVLNAVRLLLERT